MSLTCKQPKMYHLRCPAPASFSRCFCFFPPRRQLLAEYQKRGKKFKHQLEFVAADTLTCLFANFAAVWLSCPTVAVKASKRGAARAGGALQVWRNSRRVRPYVGNILGASWFVVTVRNSFSPSGGSYAGVARYLPKYLLIVISEHLCGCSGW